MEQQRNSLTNRLPDQFTVLDSPPIVVKNFYQFKNRKDLDPWYRENLYRLYSKSILNVFRIREIIFRMEEHYEDKEIYLFQGGKNVLVLVDLIETFIDKFFDLYYEKMITERKISFFTRIFEETLTKLLIKPEIRELDGFSDIEKNILKPTKFKHTFRYEQKDILETTKFTRAYRYEMDPILEKTNVIPPFRDEYVGFRYMWNLMRRTKRNFTGFLI